ncbi:FtsB family cell division protein [Fundicoccus culcitae]|uniref:Septum formation initiator family protein n=1 Tax=Fundicoccus culcitae TaxID=2969821 RepID=A0ABY5P2F0_9LACT|nr:septum formation initiator family protein [Fundicoccus culcitae]UUX32886.1 septum formation initiator family protein [Fundicoccus culcitae]
MNNEFQGNYRKEQKVIHLNPSSHQKPINTDVKRSTHRFRGFSKALLYIGLLIVLSIFVVPLYQTYTQSQQVKSEYEQAVADNTQAAQRYQTVQDEFQLLQNPEYIAEIARRDYYYSKPNEIIFDLGENNQSPNSIFNESQPE